MTISVGNPPSSLIARSSLLFFDPPFLYVATYWGNGARQYGLSGIDRTTATQTVMFRFLYRCFEIIIFSLSLSLYPTLRRSSSAMTRTCVSSKCSELRIALVTTTWCA